MKREELKRLWKRSKTDKKFRRIFLAMLRTLVWQNSKPQDRLAACELATFVLKNAGAAGRKELRDRLRSAGCEY